MLPESFSGERRPYPNLEALSFEEPANGSRLGDDRVSIGFLLFLRFSFGEGLNFGSEFLGNIFQVSPTECVLATVGTWFDFHPSFTGETSSRTTS